MMTQEEHDRIYGKDEPKDQLEAFLEELKDKAPEEPEGPKRAHGEASYSEGFMRITKDGLNAMEKALEEHGGTQSRRTSHVSVATMNPTIHIHPPRPVRGRASTTLR